MPGVTGTFRSFTFGIGARPIASGEHMHKSHIAFIGAAGIGLASLAAAEIGYEASGTRPHSAAAKDSGNL